MIEQTKPVNRPPYPFLEQMLKAHPPQVEVFEPKSGRRITAKVSRGKYGKIIYVLPGSVRDVTNEVTTD